LSAVKPTTSRRGGGDEPSDDVLCRSKHHR
jgi:hypothetical protein